MSQVNIVIIGVGGQGTLLASRILGALAVDAGLEVKVSEVHGMAQRGGSVITHVRMGADVRAPLVSPGTANFVLAFEALEALRALPYVAENGVVVANDQRILPMPVIVGAAEYPEDIAARMQGVRVQWIHALDLARQAGSLRAANVALLGAMARHTQWAQAAWTRAISACVPSKTLDVNLKAFELGYNGPAV